MPKLLDSSLYSIVKTDGSIGAGWKLNFYRSGTSTRQDTFPTEADALAGTNANANPVVIPADGRIPPCWLTDTYAYKGILTDENAVVKETVDPLREAADDLSEIILFPEDFGADGLSTSNQNAAFEALMIVARTVGKATISLTPGSTYTVTNPFMFGGCRELVIEGNGATLMNYRTGDPTALGIYVANFAPFRSPVAFAPNGVEVQTYGTGQSANDYGVTISTVAMGATSVTTVGGSIIPAGRALVYGWDRYGVDGFPPTASYFEYVDVSVAGATATLRQKLRYGYDASAPEKTTSDRAGVARLLSLVRTAGANQRAHTDMDSLTVRNLTFATNPGQNAAGNATYNGVPAFGGAKRVILENLTAPYLFFNCAEYVECTGLKIAYDLEIDKMLGTVVIGAGCEINNLVGALGTMRVFIHDDAHIYGTNALCPMELLDIGAASIGGLGAFAETSFLSNYVSYGSAEVRIHDTRFVADNSTVDRIVQPFAKSLTPTITSTTVLTATRAAYDASGWQGVIRLGSLIYAGNIPVAVVTRMPYVPTPPLTTGDVAIGYKLLGGAIAGATALSIPVLQDVRISGERIEGTYARQITAPLGSDVVAAGNKLCNLRTDQIRENGFWFDQTLSEYARASNIYEFSLGRGFRVTSIEFDVTRIAVDAGAVTGVLKARSVLDTTLALVDTIDLKTGGATARRVLASGGLTGGGGADLIGTGAFPTTAIVSIRFTDGSKALTEGNRAGWRCNVMGYWL